jgi:hypothetical protein
MRLLLKGLAIGAGGLVVLLALAVVCLYRLLEPTCGNQVLAQVASPDALWKAVVFQRDCGATTGFSTQVSILRADDTLSGSGNVFTADTNRGAAPDGPGGGPEVLVRWTAPTQVEIAHHAKARVFAKETRVGFVHIKYATLP